MTDLQQGQPASSSRSHTDQDPAEQGGPHRIGRRRFIGYLLAAPTAVGAARLGVSIFRPESVNASMGTQVRSKFSPIPSNAQLADIYDLNDQLTDTTMPTMNMIRVVMNKDGTASFALHRTEVGQGITTAIAMLIAEELDLPIEKVDITLRDADPSLQFNQLTAGSNSMNALYYPVRVAAAVAKGALFEAAAIELGFAANFLTSKAGIIGAPDRTSVTYAAMAHKAAVQHMKQVAVQLKPSSAFTIIGKPQTRIEARSIVTGEKTFTMDMVKPDAWPTMLRRPPTINGTVRSVNNAATIKAMPGITDVVPIRTGVAVRGRTFGQVIDAIRALDVTWGPGPVDSESDATVLQKLKAATPAMLPTPPGAKVLETELPIAFSSNSSMETNNAIADVTAHDAEIWASCKIPIYALQNIAKNLGLPASAVKFHVMPGGGSFGRKLFHDAALEAAEVSQKIGKPVRLMWSRTDDFQQGRVHPFSYQRIRVGYTPTSVVSFEQHYTSVRTDFSHGYGEIYSATYSRMPAGGLSISEDIFESTQNVPYNFGPTKQVLNEIFQTTADNQPFGTFNTTSMRNVYSPDVTTALELTVDQLARLMGSDPYHFRRAFVKDEKLLTVLDKAAQLGGWGRSLPDGIGQGIAVHREYKQKMACFAEVDARPQTVNRNIPDAVTGPRVTRAVYVTLPGAGAVNPLGMEAMIQGGFMDGTAKALTSSMHLSNGSFLEGSWDDYFYTRQWNVPPELQVVILKGDPNDEIPGSGEAGVAASMAAVAGGYAAATKTMPSILPVNHHPLSFTPYPLEPSTPLTPDSGLQYGF